MATTIAPPIEIRLVLEVHAGEAEPNRLTIGTGHVPIVTVESWSVWPRRSQ